jgi:hypothetical protein
MIKLEKFANPFGSVAAQIAKSRAERERRAEHFNEIRDAITGVVDATANLRDAFGAPLSEKARAIIRAGMKRRGELPVESTAPRPGTLAEKIIQAGKKRRGEI